MSGLGRPKITVGLLILSMLSVTMVAMPITATEDLSGSGTASTVSPTATTADITITVNDSSNGAATASTSVTIADSGNQTDSGNNQTLPTELSDKGVTATAYNAVLSGDDQLSATNLAPAIRKWAGNDGTQRGFIDGTRVTAGDLSKMINYWRTLG